MGVDLSGEDFVEVSHLLHCAVYALVRSGEVVYVGQSKKPLTRIYTHAHAQGKLEPWRAGHRQRKMGFKFDGIWVRSCMLAELDSLEARMIAKYQPRYNVKGMPRRDIPPDIAEVLGLARFSPMLNLPPEPRIRRRL